MRRASNDKPQSADFQHVDNFMQNNFREDDRSSSQRKKNEHNVENEVEQLWKNFNHKVSQENLSSSSLSLEKSEKTIINGNNLQSENKTSIDSGSNALKQLLGIAPNSNEPQGPISNTVSHKFVY